MQKFNLPTSDHFADAFDDFQKSAMFTRLVEKFEVKPYWKKYRLLRLVVLVASYTFNLFSAVTAAALVYFFTLGLSGHWIPAGLATITALTLLETSKRITNGTLWRDLLQFKKVAVGLAGTVLLLSALSVASSYFGAKRVIAEFTPPAQVVDADSAAAQITAQITAIDQQISDARRTTWKGITTTTSARTIDKLTAQKTALLEELTRTRARVDQVNDATTAAHTTTTHLKAEYFALVTLLLEVLFILTAFYLEYYDFRSLAEFATPDDQQADHAKTGAHKSTTPKENGAPYAIPYQVEKVAPQVTGNGHQNGTMKNQALPIGFFTSRTAAQTAPNAMRYITQCVTAGDQDAVEVVEVDPKAKACDQCGGLFTARTTWQRFCCPDCRTAYHAAQHDGAAFDPAQYRRKGRGKTMK
jgi:hypothetical protein